MFSSHQMSLWMECYPQKFSLCGRLMRWHYVNLTHGERYVPVYIELHVFFIWINLLYSFREELTFANKTKQTFMTKLAFLTAKGQQGANLFQYPSKQMHSFLEFSICSIIPSIVEPPVWHIVPAQSRNLTYRRSWSCRLLLEEASNLAWT